ncbi:antibiotic biosynthesis monooxygenase [soil metagenome]|jgi:heme-degrading monooxygenase HmoA|nr:antibiotic biosynthesis monooxygenase [Acidobacteriota bacterium]
MSKIVKTPKPPYYTVIFTSIRTEGDNGYDEMANQMAELSAEQTGFLGMEHARSEGLSVTICYWENLEAIDKWRENAEHKLAQAKGYEMWYQAFATRVCKVERDNIFEQK